MDSRNPKRFQTNRVPDSAVRMLMLAPVLFLSDPLWPADSPAPAARTGQQAGNMEQVAAWLPRLVGKFRLEGSVELAGEAGTLRRESIEGQVDCQSIATASRVGGRAPGVECYLDMLW